MNTAICLYFQVHQPFRLRRDYSFFSIGPDHQYEDHYLNKKIMRKVAQNCYLPMNELVLQLIKKHGNDFKLTYSISGLALEQFALYTPEVIESFEALVSTGNVELLSETYYHSLAFIKSPDEFIEQIKMHRQKIQKIFQITPTVFRNTELIYNNDIASIAEKMGFQGIIAEGCEQLLGQKKANYVYRPSNCKKIKLLLKNPHLSDDISFRFSNKHWKHYPLTTQKYYNWIKKAGNQADVINLCMDYETFGEHQSKETGIFNFFKELPQKILSEKKFIFMTPSQIIQEYPPKGTINAPEYTSWADSSKDLSAWLGNPMQNSAFNFCYSLEKMVKKSRNYHLLHKWRKLLSSDHTYYTCTKQDNDGDIHNYFNPYGSPHNAFLIYTNVLNDLKLVLEKENEGNSSF